YVIERNNRFHEMGAVFATRNDSMVRQPAWTWLFAVEDRPGYGEKVNIHRRDLREDELAQLVPLNRLRVICLSGSNVTNASLEHLRQLPLVDNLQLNGTFVTDAGI